MPRLQFHMWEWRRSPFDEKHDGYMSQFTDGNGIYTDSWWSNPPSSIDHVDGGYLQNRHPNVRNARHEEFIKRRFKEEMSRLRPEAIETTEVHLARSAGADTNSFQEVSHGTD